jgi:hypothetical protein
LVEPICAIEVKVVPEVTGAPVVVATCVMRPWYQRRGRGE